MKIPGAHWHISLVAESPVCIVSQGDARKKHGGRLALEIMRESAISQTQNWLMPPKTLLREIHIRIPSHSIKKDNNPNKTILNTEVWGIKWRKHQQLIAIRKAAQDLKEAGKKSGRGQKALRVRWKLCSASNRSGSNRRGKKREIEDIFELLLSERTKEK